MSEKAKRSKKTKGTILPPLRHLSKAKPKRRRIERYS